MIFSTLFFIITLITFSIRELHAHGKLKWMSKDPMGFWGEMSYERKYKGTPELGMHHIAAPNNWYYNFFKVKYKERFPLSATLLVFLTDAPHFLQFVMFTTFSIGIAFAFGLGFWMWLGTRILISVIHFAIYNTFQK